MNEGDNAAGRQKVQTGNGGKKPGRRPDGGFRVTVLIRASLDDISLLQRAFATEDFEKSLAKDRFNGKNLFLPNQQLAFFVNWLSPLNPTKTTERKSEPDPSTGAGLTFGTPSPL